MRAIDGISKTFAAEGSGDAAIWVTLDRCSSSQYSLEFPCPNEVVGEGNF
jgi:hypothetical protein